jgi:hypothetical protein
MAWIFTGSGSRFQAKIWVAKHVPGFDDDVVGRHDLFEGLQVDRLPVVTEVMCDIDQDASTLYTVCGHVLQT